MLQGSKFIGVAGFSGQVFGTTVHWQCKRSASWGHEFKISGAALRQELTDAGVSDAGLPAIVTPKRALAFATTKHLSATTEKTALAGGGWAINNVLPKGTEKAVVGETMSTLLMTTVVVQGTGIAFPVGDQWSRLANDIRATFADYLAMYLTAADTNAWLKATVERIGGGAFTVGGSNYWVPAAAMEEWATITQCVNRVDPNVFFGGIPLMDKESAVASIVFSATEEAEQLAQVLLDKIATGETGRLALTRRAEDCEAFCKRLEGFETLLGATLDTVKAKIGNVQAACYAAALIAQAEKDATAAQG